MRETNMYVGKDNKGRVVHFHTASTPERVLIWRPATVHDRGRIAHNLELDSAVTIHDFVRYIEDEHCGWEERTFSCHSELGDALDRALEDVDPMADGAGDDPVGARAD